MCRAATFVQHIIYLKKSFFSQYIQIKKLILLSSLGIYEHNKCINHRMFRKYCLIPLFAQVFIVFSVVANRESIFLTQRIQYECTVKCVHNNPVVFCFLYQQTNWAIFFNTLQYTIRVKEFYNLLNTIFESQF